MYPKAKSLGIILNENKVLMEEQNGRHSQGTGVFYRPLGGTIEFGESSKEMLIREYKEEISVAIQIEKYLGCLENIFDIEGQVGHEIIQIYLVRFVDPLLLQQDQFEVKDLDKHSHTKWVPLIEILENGIIVYPVGLSRLLKELLPNGVQQ